MIKEKLAERLLTSGSDVKNNILDTLYNNELKTRTDACLKVLTKIEEKEKELKKLKVSDNNIYDEKGTVVAGGYSKARVDDIKKVSDELERLNKALENALENNDFTKVLELGK